MRILQITLSLSLILLFTTAASAKIVFSAYKNGNDNIYVMGDDGSNITQLTNTTQSQWQPRWSPDGQQIAFMRDTDPSNNIYRNTFIMNADGTNLRQLTNHKGNDRGLAFSPDGRKLLIGSSPNTKGLHIMDFETGNVKRILNLIIGDVDWSPDGKQIVFVNTDSNIERTEDNIWIMNADGTNVRPWAPPIIPVRTMDRDGGRWSPDGQQILYTEIDKIVEERKLTNGAIGRSIKNKGTNRYITRDLSGGASQQLTIPENWYPHSVAWMDDGKSVLFCAYVPSEDPDDQDRWTQIYRYDITSGAITQLTHNRGHKPSVDWVSDDASSVTSVSSAGKQSVRWGELKKAYSD